MSRDDILLTVDSAVRVFEREIEVPSRGSYWFIIENRTVGPVEMSLKCSAPKIE